MNKHSLSSFDKALDHYHTAEHLFHTTLPITKDSKLLLSIVQSLSNCLENALIVILNKENIAVPDTLLQKINTVRPFADKYNFSKEEITFMLRIHEILHLHKQSPMEFKRDDSHIICSDNYNLEILSAKDIKLFLQPTKKILHALKTA